jgi:hypothetical protein
MKEHSDFRIICADCIAVGVQIDCCETVMKRRNRGGLANPFDSRNPCSPLTDYCIANETSMPPASSTASTAGSVPSC